MSDHETRSPEPEPEPKAEEQNPDRGPAPRRLFRSRDDRVVGGVAGGLGKYFDVDPVFFRVGFVATAFLGGLGVFLYLAALLFVPAEPSPGEEPRRRSRALTIAAAALLIVVGGIILSDGGWWFGGSFFGPLGFLLVAGAVVWWLVWGRSGTPASPRATLGRIAIVLLILLGSALLAAASLWASAAGGGVAVAILVIAIGTLLAAAAFWGGARWLIVPALAIAAGLGVVAAADVDLDGGYGKRVYAPSSPGEIRSGYDLGAGSLEVDLRGIDFAGDERRIDLEVGIGEAVLVVPRDVCVVTNGDVGAGYLRVLGWDTGGLNVAWREGSAQAPKLVVDAHVGLGALQVVHDPRDAMGHEDDWNDIEDSEDPSFGRSPACEGPTG